MENISYSRARSVSYDEGMRAFMLKVYNYMSIALALTGITAFLAANVPAISHLLYFFDSSGRIVGMTPLAWIVNISPIVMVFAMGHGINNITINKAQTLFWLYSALIGLSLSSIFFMYTGESITRVFLITSILFSSMSLYGYQTNKDLTSLGSFLTMGLFGVIIASIVNILLKSSAIYFAVSFLGVIIFTGLVAYDTQRLKGIYHQVSNSPDLAARYSIVGALNLYMNFINLFLNLLHLFGQRRDN